VRFPKILPHFVMGLLLLPCFIWFDRPLGLSSLAQSNDAASIRLRIGRLFDLYQQKDLDKLISFWSEKSPFLSENKKALQRDFAAFEKIIIKGFDIRKTQTEGDKATLQVVAELALTRAHLVKPVEHIEKKNRTIHLVKEQGVWNIWSFVTSEEELATAIMAAKTEEERKALIEQVPEFVTSDLVDTLINLIYASAEQVGYQHALAINQLAYKLADQIGDPWVMIAVLRNAGYIYSWIGTPERSPELALEQLRKSLKIGEEFGFKDVMATTLLNIARMYHDLGEFSHATKYYQDGLKLAQELGNQVLTIRALNNMGVIYRTEGNYAKALELQLKCLKISESHLESGEDWGRLARAFFNIAGSYGEQGNLEQALAYHTKAIEAAEKGIALGDISAELSKANALASIGDVYLAQGNRALALDFFQKSLKLQEERANTTLFRKDNSISTLKMYIGHLWAAENNVSEAIANYQEALHLVETSSDKTRLAYPLWGLGKMHLLRGDYREALSFAERAVENAEQANQYPYAVDALLITANAYKKLGQLEKAHQTLARAIDITEQLRDQSAGSELDLQRSFEVNVAPYYAMIDLKVDQKQFTEAFSYAQRAKGRTLLELLQNGRISIDKSVPQAEREQEQQLKRKLVSLNRQITEEKLKSQPDVKRIAGVEEQLKNVRLEFESFQTALYAAHPGLKVHRGEIRPVSFDDAVSLIPDTKTALLDFIITDENVHLFVLTKGASAQPALNTYTVKIERKSLAEKVERFRRRMENRDYDFQALSKELYLLLIKPAEKQLQNKTNLIISPDNVLWDLPFQALLSPELRYLIEDAAISYAPSLSVLREMRLASKKKRSPAKASILALGNPALGTRSRELVKFVKMDSELQPLPEAAAQVRALGRLYGPTLSKVLTDSAAREELVKENSARYRILHLATHGILNDVSPMYSHVMLSQTTGKSDEDGLLEAWEMMNLDLNADLVVLAACETARGRAGAGEGMIGMSWALFVAGCPRTVVSQWKVEAASTTALMVEFHKRFKTRYGGPRSAYSTAEAMRQAALKVMKNPEYVHPFYWGGFVVVGDGN
jgi:CHAT domain-containing protein/Tfp pilus assembly protein PilF